MLNSKCKFKRRKDRVRVRIKRESGLPRLSVFRSNKHIHAQVIDDSKGITIAAASTQQKDFSNLASTSNIDAAKLVGTAVAKNAILSGVKKVVFDKGGYKYHGLIKALADSARESGLVF